MAHVRALLGGHDVQRLLGEPPAEVHGYPAHEGVARDLHALDRDVVHLAGAPVLEVGELGASAGARVELKGAGVQRLALEGGAQAVLADRALRVLADDRQRVRVLRGAGLVDQVGGLDRVLDPSVGRHMHECSAGPEGGGGGGELALVVGEAAHVELAHQVRVLLHGRLERAHDHALLRQLRRYPGVHRARPALDDQGAELVFAQRLGQQGRHLVGRLVAARLERIQVQVAQARGPEARPPPRGHGLGVVGLERLPAHVLQPARRRHRRPPPGGRTRSPCPPARRPAPGRPRGRSGRRA